MKIIFSCIVGMLLFCASIIADDQQCFTGAVTTGYVFKHNDDYFKRVYGHGIQNIITADGCYYWRDFWGIGAKISYWHAKGSTTFLKKTTHLHEVPLTFYFRKLFECGHLSSYISLGGGVVFVKERSYLGCVEKNKGIGELEIGANYPVCSCADVVLAFRYLFPKECIYRYKADVGGFDLRVGFSLFY